MREILAFVGIALIVILMCGAFSHFADNIGTEHGHPKASDIFKAKEDYLAKTGIWFGTTGDALAQQAQMGATTGIR